MRRVSLLLAPLLLLAGYAAGRFTATPATFIAAQDDISGFVSEPVSVAEESEPSPPPVRIQNARTPAPAEVKTPRQVFQDDFSAPDASQGASAKAVAEARQPIVRQREAVRNDNDIDPFAEPALSPTNPPQLSLPPGGSDNLGFEVPLVKAAPAFIPTPLAASTEQEEKYLNAALKVFRGLGETERQAEFEQMIGRMEEQDAAAELLRLRTELQQLSEKYPKTGAAKKALEAIQTLPVVNPPEARSGELPVEAALPAAPPPAVPEILQDAP